MCFKEIIQMIVDIVLVTAAFFAIYSLRIHRKAVELQIRNLKASIFDDITQRINELVDNEPDSDKESEMDNWYARLYNAFEQFAFFANHSYLDLEMVSYYKSFIETYNRRVVERPSTIEMFKKDKSPDEYKELKKLCGELPF